MKPRFFLIDLAGANQTIFMEVKVYLLFLLYRFKQPVCIWQSSDSTFETSFSAVAQQSSAGTNKNKISIINEAKYRLTNPEVYYFSQSAQFVYTRIRLHVLIFI